MEHRTGTVEKDARSEGRSTAGNLEILGIQW
jgi:hypothetical protein